MHHFQHQPNVEPKGRSLELVLLTTTLATLAATFLVQSVFESIAMAQDKYLRINVTSSPPEAKVLGLFNDLVVDARDLGSHLDVALMQCQQYISSGLEHSTA